MIEIGTGNILEADVEALVNTVNCVGIMGRGIALQFKEAFPSNFASYKSACESGDVKPGKMYIFDLHQSSNPRYIINFPTKRHWKGKSKIQDIENGLQSLVADVRRLGIRSIALPPLGSGLGGLDWSMVRPLIEGAFRVLPSVRVVLFAPTTAPMGQNRKLKDTPPAMTPGRAALIGLIHRYFQAVMDPHITLLEIHKLMYFMQEAGEPLRLNYVKGLYGPYAENLRHVLSAINEYYITGFHEKIDNPSKEIELKIEAAELADAFLADHPETRERFERVVRLIRGFETSYGMELLATVYWVARNEEARTKESVTNKVHDWSGRKKLIPEKHITLAFEVLEDEGWLLA